MGVGINFHPPRGAEQREVEQVGWLRIEKKGKSSETEMGEDGDRKRTPQNEKET